MEIKYPLATTTWTDAEKNAAKAVIDSGFCTMGEKTKLFEKEFAKFVGAKYAVFSNSGSSANLLAISALMYRKNNCFNFDDEIIVPAVSWSTTYYPIFQNRMKMVFVDIDADSLNIDVNKIEDAITNRTRAIFAVNLLGNPCDFRKLKEICEKYKLELLIDNCESMGALYKKQEAGSLGLIGTYSSFFSHHICTVEGGLSVTNDKELYEIMLSLRAHGWTRNLPNKNHVHNKDGNPFNDMFRFVLPGYNLRPNEIFAAIGLEQIRKLPEYVKDRRNNHDYFMTKLAENEKLSEVIRCQSYDSENSEPSWFGFALVLIGKFEGRRKKITKLLMENGIECRPIVAGNFTKNPVIKWMEHNVSGEMTNAKYIDENGLFVGNNPGDLKPQINHLFHVLNKLI